MRIMDINYNLNKVIVTIKDTTEKKIHCKIFDLPSGEIMNRIYRLAKHLEIDEIHIDTTAHGIIAYDYLSDTDVKDKIIPFTYKKMLPPMF